MYSSCESCQAEHHGEYGSGRFCSSKCARSFATKAKRIEINAKVAEKLKGRMVGGALTLHSSENAKRRIAAHQKHYANLPFEARSTEVRRQIVFDEQGRKCLSCDLGEWLGEPIAFEMDHIDGDSRNNARANLRGLCPNCHSLTPTWRGKNKRKAIRIDDATLVAALKNRDTIRQALDECGMATKGNNYTRAKRLIREHNIRMTGYSGAACSHSPLTQEDIDQILLLRTMGETQQAIADRFGISHASVRGVIGRERE